MSDKIRELLRHDPIAADVLDEAESQLGQSKATRDMLRRVRREARKLAEEFLQLYLTGTLGEQDAEAIKKELRNTTIERKIPRLRAELAQAYKYLGLIREYTTRSIELDYPQALVDPLILRAYDPTTVDAVGEHLGVDISPLTDVLSRGYRDLELTADLLARPIAEAYQELSRPLLLKYQALNATKVYFMGPVFYGNARRGWSLTFSTGSGLPDPLEWNGSRWFSKRYGIPRNELGRLGVGLKNPFRALNFSAGITHPRWRSRRIYVWQRSRTSEQTRTAYALAYRFGKGEEYIADAVNQLFAVFRTPSLKVLALEQFDEPLRAWTRLSKRDIMISGRPDTAEGRIGHASWLTPGLRLSDAALVSVERACEGILALHAVQTDDLQQILSVLAIAGVVFLSARHRQDQERQQALTIQRIKKAVDSKVNALWKSHEVRGTIKQADSYTRADALRAAVGTLAELLGLDPPLVLAVSQGRTAAPDPAQTG